MNVAVPEAGNDGFARAIDDRASEGMLTSLRLPIADTPVAITTASESGCVGRRIDTASDKRECRADGGAEVQIRDGESKSAVRSSRSCRILIHVLSLTRER
jgi:hypothetical protein